MQSAKVTFSNGEAITLGEGLHMVPIVKYDRDGEIYTSMDKTYEIWNHVHDGLIPSITELLCSGLLFANCFFLSQSKL